MPLRQGAWSPGQAPNRFAYEARGFRLAMLVENRHCALKHDFCRYQLLE